MSKQAKNRVIQSAYRQTVQRYAQLGLDVDQSLERLSKVAISLNCWQGDDIAGFETPDAGLSGGGIMVTGNYPGRARNGDELRMDLDKAFSLIPGKHRVNLHAIYAETAGSRVERNELLSQHFSAWIDWAKANGLGIDFNGTFFSHPKAANGFTLSNRDQGIRRFWIEHGIACRKIGEHMGRQLNNPCVVNIWIPDGYKDVPIDRKTPREILKKSLDDIFAQKLDSRCTKDAIECKLFGIGSESYVVGSHEFYLAYAITNSKLLCLDAGHFHPTEVISDKISSLLIYLDEILLHVSRPVRWDSDHVVILSDELRAIAQEIIRGRFLQRVHIGLDFFDASINRVAAWIIATRCVLRALLIAMLEPIEMLCQFEAEGDLTARLAILEELKALPFGAVWDYYCLSKDVPVGPAWLDEIRAYENTTLAGRI